MMHQPCDPDDVIDFYIPMNDTNTYVFSDVHQPTDTRIGIMNMILLQQRLTYVSLFCNVINMIRNPTLHAQVQSLVWQKAGGLLS